MASILKSNSVSSEISAKQQENCCASAAEHVDGCSRETNKQEDEVESAQLQMNRVREENSKLKMLLEQIENDYKSLQERFFAIVQQPPQKSKTPEFSNEDVEEPELVSLRLGTSPTESKKGRDTTTSSSSKTREDDNNNLEADDGLELALVYNYSTSTTTDHPPPAEVVPTSGNNNSLTETKEDEAVETWPPSKILKTMRSGGDDELSQPTVKRARVSVRARCDQPTLHDGCQWRKYGQKIAKGNPCPRAYYRCTVAPSCPVRKQVQRCSDDMSILITTYEGTHNHPLPVSATAMASTTSAAASMLLSGSSSSSPSGFNSSANHLGGGLNLNLSDTVKTRPFYLPNSVPQFPTITLDLTAPSSSTTPSQFNIFSSSSSAFQSSAPRFNSASLNFAAPESSMLPSVWSSGFLNYGSQQPYNKHPSDSSSFSRPPQQAAASQQVLAETLTKAITTDPSVRSVIAAAISSMVSSGGSSTQPIIDSSKVENLGQNFKWGDQIQVLNSTPITPSGKNCASSFLNRSTSLSSQTGSLRLQPPPLALSNTSSRSTVENRDQTD